MKHKISWNVFVDSLNQNSWKTCHELVISSKFLTSVDRMGLFDDQVAMVQTDSGSTVRLLKMAKHFRYFFFFDYYFVSIICYMKSYYARYKFMPCPFTGPKMFWAGPNILCQTKNLFTYCGSHKHFVPDKKMISIQ